MFGSDRMAVQKISTILDVVNKYVEIPFQTLIRVFSHLVTLQNSAPHLSEVVTCQSSHKSCFKIHFPISFTVQSRLRVWVGKVPWASKYSARRRRSALFSRWLASPFAWDATFLFWFTVMAVSLRCQKNHTSDCGGTMANDNNSRIGFDLFGSIQVPFGSLAKMWTGRNQQPHHIWLRLVWFVRLITLWDKLSTDRYS